ncbi:MAG TPA: hypothetical protein VFB20_07240 [Burkholderiales bacterium]|nr:hypothetical protein [Burkholderiales bacterium]
MTRVPINPGRVDWSGENPGMYLKESQDGSFVTLISFFRVVTSPHGKGHAAFLLLEPSGKGEDPLLPNVCLTDNEPLAEYLCRGFVSHFGAFRGAKGLDYVQYRPGWDFMPGGDGHSIHTEWFRSAIGQVNLTWSSLSEPFLVEFDQERSATGRHEMISLFFDARRTHATINGKAVAGKPFPREFAGKKDSSTAFLAFSETWIKA